MFNKILPNLIKQTQPTNYNEYENIIKQAMESTIGKIKINVNEYKPKENKTIKEKRHTKKIARKAYDKACKKQYSTKQQLKEIYIQTQIDLRQEIENHERTIIRTNVEKITKDGGAKSQTFWKMRKKLLGKKPQGDYNTITEQGTTLENADEAKEHIAQFYENLYQARPSTTQYIPWTNQINHQIQQIDNNPNTEDRIANIQ